MFELGGQRRAEALVLACDYQEVSNRNVHLGN
jgi:hypothetical protein